MDARLRRRALLAILIPVSSWAMNVSAQSDAFPVPRADWPASVHDNPAIPFVLLDRLEYRLQKGANARSWDAQGWMGGDYNKFWMKTEGEQQVGGGTESAEVQALYARLVSPFWYVQAGVRADLLPHPSRNQIVLAVQGLAPYWFDVEASAFIGEGGKVSGRLEAEYDFLITQRLILQPRAETNFAASSDAVRGTGSGIQDVEVGLRLRYEFSRQFAPYVGVNWTRQLGSTADLARNRGDSVRDFGVVLGVRAWF